ncbi:hypothetical protein [Streptomyces acidiscabies]|uniref:hypothetical protein n=1 Tax=Streptomyces acidiscabies TaxID=42234 RepID=UPI00028A12F5|nr:hypothetical protein [Streptomyces acidiscabies]GAQ52628.1 hypothetical protein a10_02423 [Streptomyces acidiscabies]GAV39833.1 hypothetical protein Saa2_02720 [Streptomyces acidiscabies]
MAAAYDIVLLTGTEPSWEKPFIVDHPAVDLRDPAALLAGGRALAEHHDLADVVTWDEWHLVLGCWYGTTRRPSDSAGRDGRRAGA